MDYINPCEMIMWMKCGAKVSSMKDTMLQDLWNFDGI